MSLERARFEACLARQRAYARDKSPILIDLLDAIASDLDAPWFARLQDAWKDREFGPYYEAPLLLTTALHRAALAGEARGLARALPSCGGGGAGAGAEALAFLKQAPDSFFRELADARLQTNEAGRASGWILVACAAFLPRQLPFHLVDLGTSAGLTLIGDYLPRATALVSADGHEGVEPPHWRDQPLPVLSRVGLDARPRRLDDEADRLALKAGIWPDDRERHERFERAASLFTQLAREKSGPKLHACRFEAMPGWIASNLKPHPEEGVLVYTSQATDFLDDRAYAALADGVARVLGPWGDRGYWAELELPRDKGEPIEDERHRLTVGRWLEGRFERRVLAETTAHPRELRLKLGWDFLRPLSPLAPPRITREEKPKQLDPGVYRFPGGEHA